MIEVLRVYDQEPPQHKEISMLTVDEITQDIKAEALKIAKLNAHQLQEGKDKPCYNTLYGHTVTLCNELRREYNDCLDGLPNLWDKLYVSLRDTIGRIYSHAGNYDKANGVLLIMNASELNHILTEWSNAEYQFSDKEYIKGVITLLTQTYSLVKTLKPTADDAVTGYLNLFKDRISAQDDVGRVCRDYQRALETDREDFTSLENSLRDAWKDPTYYINAKTMIWYLEACTDYEVNKSRLDEGEANVADPRCAAEILDTLKIAFKYLSIQQSDDAVSAVAVTSISQTLRPFSIKAGAASWTKERVKACTTGSKTTTSPE